MYFNRYFQIIYLALLKLIYLIIQLFKLHYLTRISCIYIKIYINYVDSDEQRKLIIKTLYWILDINPNRSEIKFLIGELEKNSIFGNRVQYLLENYKLKIR